MMEVPRLPQISWIGDSEIRVESTVKAAWLMSILATEP